MQAKTPSFDPAGWLRDHGDYLYRYALLRLRDEAAAQDAVQDTLLAALNAWARFGGQSSVKTWLTGILKHKILDIFRMRTKEVPFGGLSGDDELDVSDIDDQYFDARGHWLTAPQEWNDPASHHERQRFWHALVRCLEHLPPAQAEAFQLREVDGLTTEEICKQLSVTPTNCWVMLYRARMALQRCLDQQLGHRRKSEAGG